MRSILKVNICGFPNFLSPWVLMRYITRNFCAGSLMRATALYQGIRISGQLKPHSIDRTQAELTRSRLVDLLTEDGTFTLNCKYLKEIDLLTLKN